MFTGKSVRRIRNSCSAPRSAPGGSGAAGGAARGTTRAAARGASGGASGGGADGAGGAAGAAAHGGVAARGSPSACLPAERPARSPAAGHRGTLLRGAHVATRWHCRRWLWLPGRLSDRGQGNRCCGHRTIACDLTDCAMRERLERQPHMLLVAADAPSLCSMSV